MTVPTTLPGYPASNIQPTPATTEAARHVVYKDNELIFKSDDDTPLARVKIHEIVFILNTNSDCGGYFIFSLAENDPGAEGSEDNKNDLFKLSVLHTKPELLPLDLVVDYLYIDVALVRDGWPILDVIISTRSGTGKADVFYEKVLKPLLGSIGLYEKSHLPDGVDKEKGYQVTVTTSSRTITEYANQIRHEKAQRTIILLSGDGGVIDLLNGLDTGTVTAETEETPHPPTVAILPLGTGNALFHSLHKPLYQNTSTSASPSNLVLALRTLFRGPAKPLPTFKASFSPRSKLISAPALEKVTGTSTSDDNKEVFIDHLLGTIVASYGFHASLVWESDTPAYRVHGDKRFGMAAAELLKESHGYKAVVEIRKPGSAEFVKVPRDKFNYVLTTMVSNLEKTFTISPASKPLDGQLRLVHFGDVGGERTMDIMKAAYQEGAHVGMRWKVKNGVGEEEEDDGVGYEEVDEVRVTVLEDDPRWRKVCIDGTIVEIEKGGWMSVSREPKGQERIKVVVNARVVWGDK